MPEFVYQARDKSGGSTSGTISASTQEEAAARVRSLGIFPTRIHLGSETTKPNGAAKNPTKIQSDNPNSSGKVSRLQILLFTREMADLLDAGLPMDRGFSVLIDQMEGNTLKSLLTSMQSDIRAGQPLSSALSKFPRSFPNLYINMVKAGELSGQLPGVMARLADFMEKEQIRRSQIMAALTYPMVLITVAISAVTFLLTFVVPKLSGVFKDMGAALPLPTVMLLAISGFIGKYWWELIMGIALIIFSIKKWMQTEKGQYMFDSFRLKAPYMGVLVQKIVGARLSRTLGTLLGGGVPILEALEITSSALGNRVSSEALINARGNVRQGETLHSSLSQNGDFLPVVLHMTAVGEETGRLPAMLIRTAETLDFEVDNALRRLTSLVEPLVVLLMGGFIGFVVLSILLPIFQANTLVK